MAVEMEQAQRLESPGHHLEEELMERDYWFRVATGEGQTAQPGFSAVFRAELCSLHLAKRVIWKWSCDLDW